MTHEEATKQLHAALNVLETGLNGMPLSIERPGKEDFVLVSAETYSNLMQRIYQLEEAVKTDEERAAEQEEILNMLKDAD